MSNETTQIGFESRTEADCRVDSGANLNPIHAGRDHRDASIQMLAVSSTAPTGQTGGVTAMRATCRHFRYRVPRVDADEIRGADPAPCHVCDARPPGKFRMVQWFG